MKTIAIIAAAAAMTVAATPAFAQPVGKFGNVSYEEKTDRYCFREVQPSTLVPRVDCRSRQDWADAGLTISRKSAVQLARR
ncbi:hypothetical protein HH800_06300 [Sphingobium yanoikuyae]|uniref:Uncharacterized protein n=1 Tax=Sphingobium yanoikuyae TaxID=13690 RepID=A0A6M4G3N7_SPHYA|nr:hypothetical protein [Sphingobium yanoikuyae]QJR01845.1 hypothetical protein HH800_06300 [Sphingobium yanoikuyae]